jgi:hypothetical protein
LPGKQRWFRHSRDSAVDPDLANELAGLVRPVFDTRKFHVGNSYRIEKEMDGELRAFEYKIDEEHTLKVLKSVTSDTNAGFEARIETLPLETKPQVIDLEIQSSLFAALDNFPKGELLADRLAGIFAWDVDFNVDIKKGAEIHLVVDEQSHAGSFVKYGPIQAAELINNGKTYRAYRFQDAYYDEKGNAVKTRLPYVTIKGHAHHFRLYDAAHASDPWHRSRSSRN